MRSYATPSPAALHKNICGSFLGAKLLSHEFPFRAGYRGDHRAVAINADPEIFGFHYLVRQGARFDDLEEARTVNYFSVRINNDPVIGDNSSKALKIVVNDRFREFFLYFQKFLFRCALVHLLGSLFRTQSPRT